MSSVPVFYTPDAGHDERAFAKLAELAERAGMRALVVCEAEHEARIRSAGGLEALQLFFEHRSEDPPRTRGLPALAYLVPPPRLLDLLDDRGVSVVIYVPRNSAELRHFTLAYPDCASA